MSARARPLVSVVTPFFNVAEYLAEAIESVLGQTYPHFEYLLVDNRSTDGSSEIAARYAATDPRIRFSTNERFLPQVANYNHALTLVSTDAAYVKIVQADDMLFPRCLEEMVALLELHPSAGLVSSYRLRGRALEGAALPLSTVLLPGLEACRGHLLGDYYLFGSPSTVMYRADVVRARGDFYADGRLHEDTEVAFEILSTHDLGFVHQVLSFSRMQTDSVSGTVRDYNPHLLDQIINLRLYGDRYLSDEELTHRRATLELYYYRFLGQAWLERREKELFDYHRKGLATVGEELDQVRLWLNAVPALINKLLHPRETAASTARRLRVGRR